MRRTPWPLAPPSVHTVGPGSATGPGSGKDQRALSSFLSGYGGGGGGGRNKSYALPLPVERVRTHSWTIQGRAVLNGKNKDPSYRQQKRMFTGTPSASWSWDLLYFIGRRLALGGWWLVAVGVWRLAVGGGGRWLVVGGWRLVAVGSWRRLAVGG